MSIKNRFRNILKIIGVIEKDKLEEFVIMSKQMKRYIENHKANDKKCPDSKLNDWLYLSINHSIEIVDLIKNNNPDVKW